MKQVLMIVAIALFSVAGVNAQDDRAVGITTAKGVNVLPVAGDFGLGMDAAPFLKYVGGLLSNTGATVPEFEGTFTGHYFLTNTTSLRAKLGVGLASISDKRLTQDATAPTDPDKRVTDVTSRGGTDIDLSIDYLFHRGYGRLQGYYGGGIGLGYMSTTTSYEYGNKITSTYTPPARPLKTTSGGQFTFGLEGVVGVEYFVAPKISIGAEANVALVFANAPKGKQVSESWDGSKVKETTTEQYTDAGVSAFRIAPQAGLFLTFYF